jgi:hypothetical protein
MWYTVTFDKTFTFPIVGHGRVGGLEFKIYTTKDRDLAITQAMRMNADITTNIQVERFRVWESETGKMNKKAKMIYPSNEHPLF